MPRHISDEKIQLLLKTYQQKPMSIEHASKQFGICAPIVSKILRSHGIQQWGKSKIFSPDLVEDYFLDIDSHEKAYFLGLITTDGCVFWKNKKNAFLAIELQKKDRYILEHFLHVIKSNKKLVFNERSNTYSVQIHSTSMVKDLSRYYILPKSSLTQDFCDFLPSEFMPDYIRGIFDGDGSFSFYARSDGRNIHKKITRICSGSENFIKKMSLFLSGILKTTTPSVYKDDNCYNISWYSNQDNLSIINYIYSTNGPCLARKKQIADKIVDEIRQYRDNRVKAAS